MSGYYYFNKQEKRNYHEKMLELKAFCEKNDISHSKDYKSFYFTLNGQKYRVSSHSPEASNKGAFIDEVQIRELYHDWTRSADVKYINAGPMRFVEIYKNLEKGIELDGNGKIKKTKKLG